MLQNLITTMAAIAALIGPMLGYASGARTTRQQAQAAARDDDRDDAEHIARQWQAMLDNQRKDFELLLAPMRDRIDGLEAKVTILEATLDRIRPLYRTALDHIREWLAWSAGPRTDPTPELPHELREEI